MMQDLKTSWKLLKYSFQFKMNIAVAIFFMVLGVMWLFLEGTRGLYIAALYVYIGPCMLVQLTYNLLYANMALVSPVKKALDGTFPNVVGLLGSLLGYALAVVYMIIFSNIYPENEMSGGNMLVVIGLIMLVTIIYYSVAYKWFVVSTILFCFCLAVTLAFGMALFIYSGVEISLLQGTLIGLGIVVGANLLGALIRKALYKLPNSPLAGGRSLRKAMI